MRFNHRGLRRLAERNDARFVPPELTNRIRRILTELASARSPRDLRMPGGARLHRLRGDRSGQWSVRVSGNWRIVFRFEDDEAVDIDLIDYH